jgi:polysaccharide export outer membrane protein
MCRIVVCTLISTIALGFSGCSSFRGPVAAAPDQPRELDKITHAEYVIEAPDELLLDAIRVIPLPPYKVGPLDSLFIQSNRSLPDEPIAGTYQVEAEGVVKLGPNYGEVFLADLTLDQASKAIEAHLKKLIRDPATVTVSLAQSRALQQIRGPHLVRPDGTVGLGLYGSVRVAGLTLPDARRAIETHLSQFLLKPEVSVDVAGFNSKVYYVVTDGGGNGEQVVRLPTTGNETVLDAVAQIGGLSGVSSKRHIWVSRPGPAGNCVPQVLPVDWCAITRGGSSDTNYQLLAGDRLYIMADPLVTTDTVLGRMIAPFERILGFVLLGNSTVRAVQNENGGNGNGNFNQGF